MVPGRKWYTVELGNRGQYVKKKVDNHGHHEIFGAIRDQKAEFLKKYIRKNRNGKERKMQVASCGQAKN